MGAVLALTAATLIPTPSQRVTDERRVMDKGESMDYGESSGTEAQDQGGQTGQEAGSAF